MKMAICWEVTFPPLHAPGGGLCLFLVDTDGHDLFRTQCSGETLGTLSRTFSFNHCPCVKAATFKFVSRHGILSLFLGCQCFGTRNPEANLLGFASIHYNDLTAKCTNLIVQEQTLDGESSKRRAKGGSSIYCGYFPEYLLYKACLTTSVRLSVNLGWQVRKPPPNSPG